MRLSNVRSAEASGPKICLTAFISCRAGSKGRGCELGKREGRGLESHSFEALKVELHAGVVFVDVLDVHRVLEGGASASPTKGLSRSFMVREGWDVVREGWDVVGPEDEPLSRRCGHIKGILLSRFGWLGRRAPHRTYEGSHRAPECVVEVERDGLDPLLPGDSGG